MARSRLCTRLVFRVKALRVPDWGQDRLAQHGPPTKQGPLPPCTLNLRALASRIVAVTSWIAASSRCAHELSMARVRPIDLLNTQIYKGFISIRLAHGLLACCGVVWRGPTETTRRYYDC